MTHITNYAPGVVRSGAAGSGKAQLGGAWHGLAWQGMVGRSFAPALYSIFTNLSQIILRAGSGRAGSGMAWHGLAWLGVARAQGFKTLCIMRKK